MEFGYFTLSDNHYDEQPAHRQPVRRRHHGRGAVRRGPRHAFGLDRRTPFQLARRALLPRPRARLYRGAHQAHPPRSGRHRAAAASSDPRRRAMGDARPPEQRPGRFRRRPRLRPARIRAVPCFVRRQPGHLRRGPRTGAEAVVEPRAASRTTASTTRSTTCGSRRKPVQDPIPIYIGSFSKPSIELAARSAAT